MPLIEQIILYFLQQLGLSLCIGQASWPAVCSWQRSVLVRNWQMSKEKHLSPLKGWRSSRKPLKQVCVMSVLTVLAVCGGLGPETVSLQWFWKGLLCSLQYFRTQAVLNIPFSWLHAFVPGFSLLGLLCPWEDQVRELHCPSVCCDITWGHAYGTQCVLQNSDSGNLKEINLPF